MSVLSFFLFTGGVDVNNTTAALAGSGLGPGLAEEVAGGPQRIRFASNFDGKSALLVSGDVIVMMLPPI